MFFEMQISTAIATADPCRLSLNRKEYFKNNFKDSLLSNIFLH